VTSLFIPCKSAVWLYLSLFKPLNSSYCTTPSCILAKTLFKASSKPTYAKLFHTLSLCRKDDGGWRVSRMGIRQ
jgi:hypothetical protein